MIADYTLLILACLLAYCTRKFMLALLFIIGLVVFEMISAGGVRSGNCWFLVVSIFGMLLMVKEDTTLKGDESLLLRYNPYYMKKEKGALLYRFSPYNDKSKLADCSGFCINSESFDFRVWFLVKMRLSYV